METQLSVGQNPAWCLAGEGEPGDAWKAHTWKELHSRAHVLLTSPWKPGIHLATGRTRKCVCA